MPALNFIKAFAHKVEHGEKHCTIRKRGKKSPPKVGSQLKLYTGMRSKSCRLLCVVTVNSVLQIKIIPASFEVFIKDKEEFKLGADLIWAMATDDGFKSISDFFKFFAAQSDEHGVFEGYLISWEPF
jgi:hypothetical protein